MTWSYNKWEKISYHGWVRNLQNDGEHNEDVTHKKQTKVANMGKGIEGYCKEPTELKVLLYCYMFGYLYFNIESQDL